MGQGESQPMAEGARRGGVSYHCLRVAEQSPAAEAGIEPFFDFVCGVQGRPLGDDIDGLSQVLQQSEGKQIVLQVYSTKRQQLRDVPLIPSRQWSASGTQQPGSQPSLLGLSLRQCNPKHALDQVWHVLDVLEGSPAQSAGLVPYGDWIVGYAGGVLRGEGDFYDVVEAHVDKPLRLFVYNADYDVTREAILVPNRSWGGEGLLGCGVGYGLLHRIPKPQERNTKISPSTAPPQSAAYIASRHQAAVPPPPPSSQKPQPPPPPPHAGPSQQQQAHQQRASDQSYNLSFGASGVEEDIGEEEEEEPVTYLGGGGGYSRYDDPYGAPPTPDAGRTSFGQARENGYGLGGSGAYLASEGVEVVAVGDGEDDGGFVGGPPPPSKLPRRGSGIEEAVFSPASRARQLGFGGHAPGIAPGDF